VQQHTADREEVRPPQQAALFRGTEQDAVLRGWATSNPIANAFASSAISSNDRWKVMALEKPALNGTVSKNANNTWTPGRRIRSSLSNSMSSRSSRSLCVSSPSPTYFPGPSARAAAFIVMGRVGLADQFRAYGRRPMSSGSEAVSHLYLLDFTHPGTASISGWAGATPEPDSGARFSAGPPGHGCRGGCRRRRRRLHR
jgi:hypothetical protein